MWGALGTQPGERWQGEQTGLTLAAPHCLALGEGPVAGCCALDHGTGEQEAALRSWERLQVLDLLASLRASPCLLPRGLVFLCLHLSGPLEGDSGSPLWLTAQSVSLCRQPGWKPPSAPSPSLSPLSPRPLALKPLSLKAASPFFFPLHSPLLSSEPISHLIMTSDHCPPPPALPSPIHLSSLKLSSLCPPICHHQLRPTPLPATPTWPLSPRARFPPALPGPSPPSALLGVPTSFIPLLLCLSPHPPCLCFAFLSSSFSNFPQWMGQQGE